MCTSRRGASPSKQSDIEWERTVRWRRGINKRCLWTEPASGVTRRSSCKHKNIGSRGQKQSRYKLILIFNRTYQCRPQKVLKHVQAMKPNDQNYQHMCWALDRKGNLKQKCFLLLRRFYAFIWKKEVNNEVKLYCNYISFGPSTELLSCSLVLGIYCFSHFQLRRIIKIQFCHRHYKLMWNFPDMFSEVPWICPYICLAAHTAVFFFWGVIHCSPFHP